METEFIKAYIGLGSNDGYRSGNILLAVRGLMEAGFRVMRLSALYETEPVAVNDHRPYLNMVAEIEVKNITPSQIMARMVRIEYLLGRRHKFLKSPRTIDLDLLIFGETRIDTDFVTVPHPRLHERKFVLVPMAELVPDLVHPVEKKTMLELLEAVDDASKVERWSPDPRTKLESEAVTSGATSSN
ncbi:MAG: 2-amino-4-hydroxy-6-hydroxymethyldihydropteridine diphosphokinase [Acidobacteriota bacterium]|nr:2-amino-4-hydroxy-6-hydroxymethyldihydropteridine diphosphokinase [Acidobacteriota bacterium]MDH3528178.1 2-amino-4-hydroxy-6-hydroxymethyldihydropteridine diphosphokinase [Acidobacteriota bacterium]